MNVAEWVSADEECRLHCPKDNVAGASAAERLAAQQAWAAQSLQTRLAVVARLRQRIAAEPETLARAVDAALQRTPADTLVAEILPLLAACRFLERDAARILAVRRLGRRGRPVWLPGDVAVVERVPFGTVLVIAPSNYPLFLPGVQVLQALVAGNAVQWKPAPGSEVLARRVHDLFLEAGLPDGVLEVLDSAPETAQRALREGVDKVVLTGSAATGRAVLRAAAETLTPVTAELSGNDAVLVLPDADLALVVDALTFGLRLNGSATCMAPRRVFLIGATAERRAAFLLRLRAAVQGVPPVPLTADRTAALERLVRGAIAEGAVPLLDRPLATAAGVHATVLLRVRPEMAVARADVFAPVLSILETGDLEEALTAQRACPLALTAAVFGRPREAQEVAHRLQVGTVLINDLIVGTADPRLPFGGRRGSGFGVTRGAEGLLEMTTPRTIVLHHGRGRRRFAPTSAAHLGLFAGFAAMLYAGTLLERRSGMFTMMKAARSLGSGKQE